MLQMVDRGALLAGQLIENQHQIDLLLLEQSRLAAEFVKTDYWDDQGSVTAYDWIRFNCHLTSSVVGDRVAVGEHLWDLAESVQAVGSGEIGYSHLVVMARTADAVGEGFDESKLLEKARQSSPGKLTSAITTATPPTPRPTPAGNTRSTSSATSRSAAGKTAP